MNTDGLIAASQARDLRANLNGRPEVTLRTYALAAVAATALARDDAPAEASPEVGHLLDQLAAVAARGGEWSSGLKAHLRRPGQADAPLLLLARELDLSLVEVLAVAVAAAVDDDALVGRALATLQSPLGGSRPTFSLLGQAFADVVPAGSAPIALLAAGRAMESGLLVPGNTAAPLPEQTLSVPLAVGLGLRGIDGAWPGAAIGPGREARIPLPESFLDAARRHAQALSGGERRVLLIRTSSIAEGRAVASAVSEAMGRRPLLFQGDVTGRVTPWLLLRQLLPVFEIDCGPGERKTLPVFPCYRGPVVAITGPEGSVETDGAPALGWSLPVPAREERERLWRLALGDHELAGTLARDHRHGCGRIALLGRIARQTAATAGMETPARAHLMAASWTGEGAGLDSLAQPLPDPVSDAALVVTSGLAQDLNLLLLRCRTRDGLADNLGASAAARYRPGVRALFVGPSGTGKTLAAGWLATKLGLPLYRVDLASVTSKYIGETEKNLAQLLARAERSEVVLLFDEADSLFGKRTEIKDANDRFANAQTNYLLQRIETFEGIALLTSNSRSRFDSAFARRLDMIVEFGSPGPEERRSLWQSHLGRAHSLSPRDLNLLAAAADLCGGHIRNAVLTASVLARDAGRPITFGDVAAGLAGEFKKLGRQLPVEILDHTRPDG
jgi:hypothetical protein